MENWTLSYALWVALAAMNLVTFVAYGLDKRFAKKKRQRIPERRLLGMAALGGSLGALLGMMVFRHKTLHWKFIILVPLFLLLQTTYALWKVIGNS